MLALIPKPCSLWDQVISLEGSPAGFGMLPTLQGTEYDLYLGHLVDPTLEGHLLELIALTEDHGSSVTIGSLKTDIPK